MWNILSEPVCSDQFGVRVARRYFCIEAQIGNNSGYALLLAGLGFVRQIPGLEYRESTVSYLNVRSALVTQTEIGGRNFGLRGLQAAGVIIAGFVPFGGTQGRRSRITLWSTVVGSVLATAYDGLIPDRTIGQTHNLDDAALRDGKLVPNNSPVKFTVFVDRESVKPLLLPMAQQMSYYASLLEEKSKQVGADMTILRVQGQLTPDKEKAMTQQKAAYDKARSDLGAAGSAPSVKTMGSARHNPIGRKSLDAESDLVRVRQALGTMVLVGDQIEYKQRIRVDANAVNPEVQPNPTISGVNPSGTVDQGATTLVTLSGQWLQNAVVKSLNCTCVTQVQADPSGKFVAVTLNVPKDFTDDNINLVITTGATSPAFFNIPVKEKPPTFSGPISVTPALPLKANMANTLAATIAGDFLKGATVVVQYAPSANGTKETLTPKSGTLNVAVDKITFSVDLDAAHSVNNAVLYVTATTKATTPATANLTLTAQ
jgi:hypothetical protein